MSDLYHLDLNQLRTLKQVNTAYQEKGEGHHVDFVPSYHHDNAFVAFMREDPEVFSLVEKVINIQSEQVKRKLKQELHEMVDQRMYHLTKRYTLRDFKRRLLKISEYWRKLAKLPGYTASDRTERFHCNMEGCLELNDQGIFFSLVCDEKMFHLSIPQRDRHVMDMSMFVCSLVYFSPILPMDILEIFTPMYQSFTYA